MAAEDSELYANPLVIRYASRAMSAVWGDRSRFSTWRKLWVALAEAERELGLAISEDQIAALRAAVDDLDLAKAAEYEKRFRHDVMAHVHAFGDAAPAARGVIHLGATSCYVTDNADLILMRRSLDLTIAGVVRTMRGLAEFARTHRALPTLGFTHFQPAQLTTVGKRACLWLYDLKFDYDELVRRRDDLKLRGAKGTTGTQASFLALFDGDHDKVRRLDAAVAERFGFPGVYAVTGQTYSRKIDAQALDSLAGLAQSASKFANDVRLLAHRKEIEEPFESEQIGSSAMPYKRNPMRCERIGGIARYLAALPAAAAQTAATQWLERTLDDSACRRLTLPQAFLAADAVLRLWANVANGLVVYPQTIDRNLRAELPFMATENILMAAVRAGGDRQELHEKIRRHSLAAGDLVKRTGAPNDLIDRLQNDPAFARVDFAAVLDPRDYVGRAPEQVDEFLAAEIDPILALHRDAGEAEAIDV
jgi:adenylosuccinate lyase